MRFERGFLRAPADTPGGGHESIDDPPTPTDGILEVIPQGIVSIGHIKHGKHVVAEGEHVPIGGQYAALSSSSDLPLETTKQMSISKLFGVDNFVKPSGFEEGDWQGKPGALVISALSDGSIAACRFRFIPEGGEGKVGRSFLQYTTCRIDEDAWYKNAQSIASHLAGLRTDPDVVDRTVTVGDSGRILEPQELTIPEHNILALDHLNPEARYLADLISARDKDGVVIPTEKFATEKLFLEALGRAVETLYQTRASEVRELRIVIGYKAPKGDWIQFMPQIADESPTPTPSDNGASKPPQGETRRPNHGRQYKMKPRP